MERSCLPPTNQAYYIIILTGSALRIRGNRHDSVRGL